MNSPAPLDQSTLDDAEIAKFSALAAQWWDEKGSFAPLHRINPVRLRYIRQHAVSHFGLDDSIITTLNGLHIVDIGCGGGLVSEPVARIGATVTGIDGSEKNIRTAQTHAKQTGTTLTYRAITAEQLVQENARFDVVLALEVVEHVANIELFLESVAALVKPGGLLIMSTLNRTVKSYAMAIIGAEYLLRWLPRGTHDWKKFLKPHELVHPLEAHGLQLQELRGMVLNPLTREWHLSERDLDVNYLATFSKA